MPKFLTLDLGTTLYKVALFDDTAKLLALERAIPPIQHPQLDRSEVDANDLVRVLIDAIARLKQHCDLRDVECICAATQGNSFLVRDEQGRPLTPFILWTDQRAAGLNKEFQEVVPGGGHLLALAKLQWLARNEKQLMANARWVTFIGDYLCNVPAIEAGVASLARIYDERRGNVGRFLARQFGLRDLEFPGAVRAGQQFGRFSRAGEFGLPFDCYYIVGCLDQYAGAIGTGTVLPGMICETTGTVLAAVRCTDRSRSDLPAGVIEGPGFGIDRYWQMSFSSNSANLLEWYRNSLPDKPTFESLTEFAQSAAPSDLVIEPYDDRGSIEASFRNVKPHHTPGQVVRAIMQRVAQSLKQQVEQLSAGQRPSEIRSAGGAAKNDYWLQMKADTLGIPFVAMDCEEPTSLGAAMLAARAMGLGSLPELAMRWCRPRKQFDPRPI